MIGVPEPTLVYVIFPVILTVGLFAAASTVIFWVLPVSFFRIRSEEKLKV